MTIETSIAINRSREVVFAHLAAIENLTEFEGFGPIPGIKKAEWEHKTDDTKGSIRKVTNTDGSTHREEVVAFDPPARIEDRIYDMDSAFKKIAKEITDVFVFTERDGKTHLERIFKVTLTSSMWYPAAKALSVMMKKANQRHLEFMKRALERT